MRTLGRLVVAAGLIVAACASPVPTPTGSVRPTPISTAIPTLVPTPSPSPEIACNRGSQDSTFLTCERAVKLALAALPSNHPPIWRIEFYSRPYCPTGSECPIAIDSIIGYVVFRVRDENQDLWVNFAADFDGTITFTSPVARFPPIG